MGVLAMNVRNFTLREFCESTKAVALGIDNSLPVELEPQAWATLAMLQTIRDRLSAIAGHDVPMDLSSGYRCQKLNVAVGSGPGSDHLKAMAADFVAPLFGHPLRIAQTLAPLVSVLGIGQLIYERPYGADRAWVHVSTRAPVRAVNRIITALPGGRSLVGVVP